MPRKKKNAETLPIIPLRGLLLFPHVVTHFDVGRLRSVAALEQAMGEKQRIFLIEQKDEEAEEPGMDDFHAVGTIAEIRQVMHLPGDVIRVLAEGIERGTIIKPVQEEPYMVADVLRYPETEDTEDMLPLSRALESLLHEYTEESERV